MYKENNKGESRQPCLTPKRGRTQENEGAHERTKVAYKIQIQVGISTRLELLVVMAWIRCQHVEQLQPLKWARGWCQGRIIV
eukprot:274506-Pelagomonas_calceolata.AAC.1